MKQNIKTIVLSAIALSSAIVLFFLARHTFIQAPEVEWRYNGSFLLYEILFALSATTSIILVNVPTTQYINKRLPWRGNVPQRIVLELLTTSLNAFILTAFLSFLYYAPYKPYISLQTYTFENISVAMIANTIATALYECAYLFGEWKQSLIRAERLKKEQLQSQYAMLKTQLNPHFLFNSLNVLASLVHIDPDKAESFIEKFARIYRYVLETSQEEIVSLEQEIEFIQSYLYLQQVRFGDSLHIEIQLSEDKKQQYIPPLALQILVENAIKHNVVSPEQPLQIRIYQNKQTLFVTNTLQKHTHPIHSTGIGLPNLLQRYELLSHLKPQFTEVNGQYIASIPILQFEPDEQSPLSTS